MISSTPMGPGFFIFFQIGGRGTSGGNYGRVLPSLADYEKRIKKLLDEEKETLLTEEKTAKDNLVKIEAKHLIDKQKEEIRQEIEYELQLEIISESLLQIERGLAEIERKRAEISLRARIMRDDDEVMILIYG